MNQNWKRGSEATLMVSPALKLTRGRGRFQSVTSQPHPVFMQAEWQCMGKACSRAEFLRLPCKLYRHVRLVDFLRLYPPTTLLKVSVLQAVRTSTRFHAHLMPGIYTVLQTSQPASRGTPSWNLLFCRDPAFLSAPPCILTRFSHSYLLASPS